MKDNPARARSLYGSATNYIGTITPQFELVAESLKLHVKASTKIMFNGLITKLFDITPNKILYSQPKTHSTIVIKNYPKSINISDYLMVYSDVIEYQYVRDTFAPLLRTVCRTGSFNETCEKIFTSPHYIPVRKSYIISINIDIRDTSGNPVQFSAPTGKVLTKLHFRPCMVIN
jgi:hypothetical protein